MKNILVLDGYNIIKKCSELIAKEKISLQNARLELIDWLTDYYFKHHSIEIIIVFDGREDVIDILPRTPAGISVVFANESADTYIKEMVKKNSHPKSITVVTDDHEVLNSVKNAGAKIKSVRELINLIHPHRKFFKVSDKPLPDDPMIRTINEELKRYWNIK